MIQRWIDAYPRGVGPWAEPLLGPHPPKVIKGEQIPYERIAAEHPDLIVAIYRALTPAEHGKLAQIAPVIAKPKGDPDYGTSWQQTTRMVGKGLGREDRATKLIQHVRKMYAKARRAHPEFAGKSAVVAMVQPGGKYYAYATDDPRSRAMSSLGFKVPTRFDKAAGSFYATISQERLDLLDADILVLIGSDSALTAAREDPLFRKLPVARHHHVLYLGDELMNAFSHNDVLSIPWTLHRIVPRLATTLGSS